MITAPRVVLAPGPSVANPQLVISAISLPLSCRYLERVWGWKELIRFCLIVIVASNVIAFGFSWIIYTAIGQEEAL